tara:strand:+ start:903 stop:1163 length:261 start_codon:yes stop_codon:yes gene_type:complete
MKFNLPKLNAPKLPKIKVPKFNILIKVLKWLGSWLKKMTRELVIQTFTILGFFIAWFSMTGSSRQIIGLAILGSLVIWLLTINFRK